MSYDEGGARKSRVVVETPTERREVEHEAVRVPERSHGVSATTVGVLVVLVVALVTILVLMLMNNQSTNTTNANVVAEQPTPLPQTTIVQQPAAQPPIVVQQPAPAAPVIVTQPAPSGGTATSVSDDAAIQGRVDKRIADDPALSALGVTATVLDGKVLLIGTVKSESAKAQVEKAIRDIKGVKSVDNQITVSS
jgi:hypothetical protein